MEMTEGHMQFTVAAILALRVARLSGLSEDVLTEEFARAMATMLACEQQEPEAMQLTFLATEAIREMVGKVIAGRDDKTIN